MNAVPKAPPMWSDHAQELSSPIEGADACGEELEYSPDYIALQVAADEKEEQQFGDTIIPAQPPNWGDVAQRSIALLRKTKDLRVIAYLARARAETDGLPGYAKVLELATGLLERYWDEIYPRTVVEGEEDPLQRINAIAALVEMEGIGRAVRRSVLARGDFGTVSVRDVESRLESDQGAESGAWNEARLRELLSGLNTPELDAVRSINASLDKLVAQIERQLGRNWVPDFSSFAKPFQLVGQVLGERARQEDPATPRPGAHAPGAGVREAPPEAFANLERREQAVQLMERISVYFERYEPGHPAAMLVRRAQRLMPLSFLEIVNDLAPEAGPAFQNIVGPTPRAGPAASNGRAQ